MKKITNAMASLAWLFSVARKTRQAPAKSTERLRDLWFYPDHFLVFNQLRKTGASSMLVFLADALYPGRNRLDTKGDSFESYQLAKLQAQSHAKKVTASVLLSKSDCLNESIWFTVVRQPQVRSLSAFLSFRKSFEHGHMEKKLKNSKEFIPWLAEHDEHRGFRMFLDFLEGGGLHQDPHWAPQVDLLVLPVASFDFVVRLEKLGTGMKAVLNGLCQAGSILNVGDENGLIGQMGWERTEASVRCGEFFDSSAKTQTENLYEKDFDLLDYRPLPT